MTVQRFLPDASIECIESLLGLQMRSDREAFRAQPRAWRQRCNPILTCVHICVHNYEQAEVDKELEFEWDESKARANWEKHKVSFATAAATFLIERLERIDDREDYGEVRWIALGSVDGTVYRIVYTWRGERLIRIVSAQKASKDEREIYYRETFSSRD